MVQDVFAAITESISGNLPAVDRQTVLAHHGWPAQPGRHPPRGRRLRPPAQGHGHGEPLPGSVIRRQLLTTKRGTERDVVFPQKRRLKQQFRSLVDEAVFHGGKLRLLSDGPRRPFKLVDPNADIAYMAWTAGQREFIPLLLGIYHLVPLGRSRTAESIKWVVVEEPEMGLHAKAIQAVMLLILELLDRGYRVVMSTPSMAIVEIVWALDALRSSDAGPAGLRDLFGLDASRSDILRHHVAGSGLGEPRGAQLGQAHQPQQPGQRSGGERRERRSRMKARASVDTPCAQLRAWKEIAPAVHIGLRGVPSRHRGLVANGQHCSCSVALDATLMTAEPNAARWDYVLPTEAHAVGMEDHPAKASEVDRVIEKKPWAERRLSGGCSLRLSRWASLFLRRAFRPMSFSRTEPRVPQSRSARRARALLVDGTGRAGLFLFTAPQDPDGNAAASISRQRKSGDVPRGQSQAAHHCDPLLESRTGGASDLAGAARTDVDAGTASRLARPACPADLLLDRGGFFGDVLASLPDREAAASLVAGFRAQDLLDEETRENLSGCPSAIP